MKELLVYQPRSLAPERAIALRCEIEEFNADYCAALDANQVELWPDFFTEDAIYRITGRENAERDLVVGLGVCRRPRHDARPCRWRSHARRCSRRATRCTCSGRRA